MPTFFVYRIFKWIFHRQKSKTQPKFWWLLAVNQRWTNPVWFSELWTTQRFHKQTRKITSAFGTLTRFIFSFYFVVWWQELTIKELRLLPCVSTTYTVGGHISYALQQYGLFKNLRYLFVNIQWFFASNHLSISFALCDFYIIFATFRRQTDVCTFYTLIQSFNIRYLQVHF